MNPLNLFYQEPDPDRWFRFDRYPRRIIRRLVRGKARPGGVAIVAINLMKGLDRLGIRYRLNDFKYLRSHPEEIACVVGKPQVIFERQWKNPILFGAGIFSHPVDCPDLFIKYPAIKKILVPGNWMLDMFEPYYPGKVEAWPAGIDIERWSEKIKVKSETDFLIYDKIRWDRDRFQAELIKPVCDILDKYGLSYDLIKYGTYRQEELIGKVARAGSVIFLCEHESQGQAYQQILATGTPILAWDRGGFWQDPAYYPNIKYGPVTSVPYWDDRCGLKFNNAMDFSEKLTEFLDNRGKYNPRTFVMENLTLEICAERYVGIFKKLEKELMLK